MGHHFHGLCDKFSEDDKGCDYIWVIVNIMTKSTHFIPIRISDFRPIYVVDGLQKTIYKILAYRIKGVLGSRIKGARHFGFPSYLPRGIPTKDYF